MTKVEKKVKAGERSSSQPEYRTDGSKRDQVTAKTKPEKEEAMAPPARKYDFKFDYYDAGNHFCRSCNYVCSTISDVFAHLHSEEHLFVSTFKMPAFHL